jgi:hypothetical protein
MYFLSSPQMSNHSSPFALRPDFITYTYSCTSSFFHLLLLQGQMAMMDVSGGTPAVPYPAERDALLRRGSA